MIFRKLSISCKNKKRVCESHLKISNRTEIKLWIQINKLIDTAAVVCRMSHPNTLVDILNVLNSAFNFLRCDHPWLEDSSKSRKHSRKQWTSSKLRSRPIFETPRTNITRWLMSLMNLANLFFPLRPSVIWYGTVAGRFRSGFGNSPSSCRESSICLLCVAAPKITQKKLCWNFVHLIN